MQETKRTCTRIISCSASISFQFSARFWPTVGLGKYWTILSPFNRLLHGQPHARVHWPRRGESRLGQRTMLAIGLFLICLGAGGIKPCVSANVGDQFGESKQASALENVWLVLFLHQRRLFHFFASLSLAPCESEVGPGWAFGIPGVAMVTLLCSSGAVARKWCTCRLPGLSYLKETFSKEGLMTLARIAMVYVFILVFWALWGMSNGAEWTLQAEKMNLHWMGMNLNRRPGANRKPNSHFDFHFRS